MDISGDIHLMEIYVDLYKGIRDRKDPVTWRTFIINCKQLLGSKDRDHLPLQPRKFGAAKKLIEVLVRGTYLEPLKDEIYYALGFKDRLGYRDKKIEVLIFNGRHKAESLLWTLADELKGLGKTVAVVNPVGHYNDGQCRILSPGLLSRTVEKLVILASTQEQYGGNVAVLANVIRTLRNPEFSGKIKEVDVVIPMFGGSRGHRLGQSEEIGFEVLEAVFNAKILALVTKDVLSELREELGDEIPKVRFLSVDIHNDDFPAKVFNEQGFQFISISPAVELADSLYRCLAERKLLEVPVRLVACDKGAVRRAELLAMILLKHPVNKLKSVEIVYIDKKRPTAGVVTEARVRSVVLWKIKKEAIVKKKIALKKADKGEFVLCYTDDMIDTGGTAKKDIELLAAKYPNARLKIFAATHPMLSKGSVVFDSIGADVYLIGNTMEVDCLEGQTKVEMVNMAPAIAREIYW